jgi:hypothetical protein
VRDIEDQLKLPVPHAGKPDEVLRLLATKLSEFQPYMHVQLTLAEVRGLRIGGWQELAQWVKVLADRKSIEADDISRWLAPAWTPGASVGSMPPIRITPKGWEQVEKLYGRIGTTTAFIAMAFGLPNRAEVQKAIEDACRSHGWEAHTIDQTEFTGSVVDRVLAEINRARFVVADFTEHRFGVYYESGYAEGRGIPVIYCVHHEQMSQAHFDTRHLNHIAWKTPTELEDRLRARIGAVIK